jgi:hypothetical protein
MKKPKSHAAQGPDRRRCFQEKHGMSSPIPPLDGSRALGPASATARATAGTSIAPTAPVSSISLETIPSSPPPEVLAQIALAAQTYDGLGARGYDLHFAHDPASGRTNIEVRDASGALLRTLSPTEAIDLAAEGPRHFPALGRPGGQVRGSDSPGGA